MTPRSHFCAGYVYDVLGSSSLPMKFLVILMVAVLAVCAFIFLQPGRFLIVDNAEKSDAIVVLGGDSADQRYWRGMELLRAGYARHMFVDATTGITYGHSFVDLAKEYVSHTAGANVVAGVASARSSAIRPRSKRSR